MTQELQIFLYASPQYTAKQPFGIFEVRARFINKDDLLGFVLRLVIVMIYINYFVKGCLKQSS